MPLWQVRQSGVKAPIGLSGGVGVVVDLQACIKPNLHKLKRMLSSVMVSRTVELQ